MKPGWPKIQNVIAIDGPCKHLGCGRANMNTLPPEVIDTSSQHVALVSNDAHTTNPCNRAEAGQAQGHRASGDSCGVFEDEHIRYPRRPI